MERKKHYTAFYKKYLSRLTSPFLSKMFLGQILLFKSEMSLSPVAQANELFAGNLLEIAVEEEIFL